MRSVFQQNKLTKTRKPHTDTLHPPKLWPPWPYIISLTLFSVPVPEVISSPRRCDFSLIGVSARGARTAGLLHPEEWMLGAQEGSLWVHPVPGVSGAPPDNSAWVCPSRLHSCPNELPEHKFCLRLTPEGKLSPLKIISLLPWVWEPFEDGNSPRRTGLLGG